MDVLGCNHLFCWNVHYTDLVILYNLLLEPEIGHTTIHHAFLGIARALGGIPKSVDFNRFDPESNQICASLALHVHTELRTFEIRPGDALLLSLVGNIPLLISKDVLRAQQNGWQV